MWYQLQIEACHRDEVESLSDLLEETGVLSLTLTDKNDEPVLEPEPGTTPLWPDVVINALYNDEQGAEQAKQLLAKRHHHLRTTIHQVADQDWERTWMDNFKPQRFGEKLWICPSWLKPPDPQAINLILDPGLAFGTGTHPTTSLCLTWLEQADLSNKTIIDYGCGSGILALAALKLGARKAQAIDIDEQALQATQNNLLANGIALQQLELGFPQSLQVSADFIIANILLAPLLILESTFKRFLNKGGTLIVSGILKEQVDTVIAAYQPDFTHLLTKNLDDWSLVTFIHN